MHSNEMLTGSWHKPEEAYLQVAEQGLQDISLDVQL